MTDETRAVEAGEDPPGQTGSRLWRKPGGVAALYGLFAVLVVAGVQLYFSLDRGGFWPEQWYWGVAAVGVALAAAALVPGYLTASWLGWSRWVLVGALLVLTAVVAASVLWSISKPLSIQEASRTAMYAGVFVLLLPAAARWGALIVDATIFGALLPPAVYGLLQKMYPAAVMYTGPGALESDARVSSTVGYYNAFGMMCAMGALLVVARIGAFRSLRSTPLRALYAATGVVFVVAMYFSFSRGALLALAAGAVVLLALAKYRFEVLGNLATVALPALWVISRSREYEGLVSRPVSMDVMEQDGLGLLGPLLWGVLFAAVTQVAFALIVRAVEGFVPEGVRRGARLAGTVVVLGAVAVGLFFAWNAFQDAGGLEEVRDRVTATYSQSAPVSDDVAQRYGSLSGGNRILAWKIAWENWREHPLTGTGGDTYQFVYDEKAPDEAQDILHPHSIWLSLLSDTGIFAFLAFAAFSVGVLLFAFYNAFSRTRSRRSRALIAGSAAAVTTYLASSTIDWHWYIPASTVPFFALAAVAVGLSRRGRKESGTTH
jgi:hypothetical protein